MTIEATPQNREIIANHTHDGKFAPGNRANPGGRPKGLAALVRAATGDGESIVQFYLDVFTGRKKANMRLRMEAAQWLSDRGWGKAENMTVFSNDNHSALANLSTDELRALIANAPQLEIVPDGNTNRD